MNLTRKKWLRLALPVLTVGALSAACGDDEEDMMGPTIDDLVGTWNATKVELSDNPALAAFGGMIDLVGTLGSTIVLEVNPNGSFTFDATATAISPALMLTGTIEITGDGTADVSVDPVEAGDTPAAATFTVSATALSLTIPDAELLDLNQDGMTDEADAATGSGLIEEVRGFEFRPTRALARMKQLGSVRVAKQSADELVVAGLGFAAIELRRQFSKSNRRRASIRASIDSFSKVVERFETALHEPDLVGLGMKRPGSPQHDQFYLGDGVSHAPVGAQAIPGLQIRVKSIVLSPLRARLVGQIALWHANIVRAKDALARARIRFREHRNGRDTAQRSDRAQSQPFDEHFFVEAALAGRTESSKTGDDLTAREEPGSVSRISLENLIERS